MVKVKEIVTFWKNEWRSSRTKAGGGILLDQGIHMLDLIFLYASKSLINLNRSFQINFGNIVLKIAHLL